MISPCRNYLGVISLRATHLDTTAILGARIGQTDRINESSSANSDRKIITNDISSARTKEHRSRHAREYKFTGCIDVFKNSCYLKTVFFNIFFFYYAHYEFLFVTNG